MVEDDPNKQPQKAAKASSKDTGSQHKATAENKTIDQRRSNTLLPSPERPKYHNRDHTSDVRVKHQRKS